MCCSIGSCNVSAICARPGSRRTDTPRRKCCTCDVRQARWTRAESSCATPARSASGRLRRNSHTSCSRLTDSCWTIWRVCARVSCAPAARLRSRTRRVRRVHTVDRRKCRKLDVCCYCHADSGSCCCSTLANGLFSRILSAISNKNDLLTIYYFVKKNV